MPKIMLINVTHAEESRVGIVTDGVLSSFEIESFSREHLKGNIYRGVIHRIHPALEAAFVDIGAERNAFLPLDEICFRNLANPLPAEPEEPPANGRRRSVRIQDILKPGDEILVQIVKEEFANKPPTLSTFYSLPGRYLVLLPGSEDAGISRRIEGDDRQRIRDLIERLQPPPGFGIIVRTAAGLDQSFPELQRDLSYLQRLWESIQQTASSKRAPALVYREHDLVLRNIRDYFTPDIDEIYVDNEEVYERARAFLREVMPGKENVLRLYAGHQPIFSQFNVENQIESIYKRRVPLKSGGSIVLDGTEALTAIDVNSGRSTRGSNQEETAFRTNREAALEIARQLRLRDVGGLIVIDFIDMKTPQHIAEVERTLRQAMREDKARHEVGRISSFGLLEISRQRLRPAAAASSCVACPQCEGYGLVRTTESAALVGLRKIHNRVAKGDVALLRASFPTEVGVYLLNQKREDVAQLEKRYGTRIQIVLSSEMLPHQSELEARLRADSDMPEQRPLRLGGVALDAGQAAELREIERSEPRAAEEAAPVEARPAPAPRPERQRQEARATVPAPAGEAAIAAAPAAAPAQAPATNGAAQEGGNGAAGLQERSGRRSRRRRGRRRGRGRQPGVAAEGLAAGLPAGEGSPLEAAAPLGERSPQERAPRDSAPSVPRQARDPQRGHDRRPERERPHPDQRGRHEQRPHREEPRPSETAPAPAVEPAPAATAAASPAASERGPRLLRDVEARPERPQQPTRVPGLLRDVPRRQPATATRLAVAEPRNPRPEPAAPAEPASIDATAAPESSAARPLQISEPVAEAVAAKPARARRPRAAAKPAAAAPNARKTTAKKITAKKTTAKRAEAKKTATAKPAQPRRSRAKRASSESRDGEANAD